MPTLCKEVLKITELEQQGHMSANKDISAIVQEEYIYKVHWKRQKKRMVK